jgi:hypothetical protein
MYGKNVGFSKLMLLILIQLCKPPDSYLKVRNTTFESVIFEQLNLGNNSTDWMNLKSEIQLIFQNLNYSDSQPFYSYINFLWYSSLPCFDVQNYTAGAANINKNVMNLKNRSIQN